MKRKMAKFLAVALLLALLGVFGASSDALAVINTQVKVSQIWMAAPPNATTNGVIVELINTTGRTIPGTTWTANSWRRFYVSQAVGNQGLAILLTAHSTQKKVDVFIEGTAAASSLLTRVGITSSPSP